MLTVWGNKERFCDGMSRRNFLQIGAFGAGLTLAEMMQLRALSQEKNSSQKKAAIMIYLPGGPSTIDMYDLKPDAPKEFRGEFNPIQTNVPGVQISEHFPMQARMWDKLACVRSLTMVNEHSDTMCMTGYSDRVNRTAHHPSFGSVVSRLRSNTSEVPQFVSLRGASRGCEPGFLGTAHRCFTPSGPGLQNLSLARGVTTDNLSDRKALLKSFDDVNRSIDQSGTLEGMSTFTERAFDMVASGTVRKALDLSREEPRTMDRYKGITQFLTARRLIEAGVGCVTLSYGGWDTHGKNFDTLKRQLPAVDRGLANLIQDLHDRGMENDVVTVMWGEFGRTPKINGGAGRDHWPSSMSAFIAGGGLKMGQAVGSTSSKGERPKDSPYTASNLLATMYQTLGIDPAMTFPNGSGRPMHVLDDRKLVRELL